MKPHGFIFKIIMKNQEKIYIDWMDRVKILQKAVIFNNSDQILALKRNNDPKRPNPGCWDLPGGRIGVDDIQKWKTKSGKGDDNDILINALRREIKEETDLEVENMRLIHCASQFSETKRCFIVMIGYACMALDKNEIKLSDEHCQYQWIDKKQFLNLEIGSGGKIIESFLDKL